jgi:vacuolar-type H+-ATPase subunit H
MDYRELINEAQEMLNDDINDIGKKFSPEEKEKILANAKKTYGEIKKSLETEGGNIAEEVRELVTRQLLKLSKAIQNEKTDPNTLTVISNQVQDSYTNQDTDKAKKIIK